MRSNHIAIPVAINLAILSIPLSSLCGDLSQSAVKVYQDRVMEIDRQRCSKPQKKKYKGLTYELCVVKGKVTFGYGDGPPGDAGPSFYLKNGKLLMFTETGTTVVYLFKDGELEAELVNSGTPDGDKVKTKFTLAERKNIIDRAVSYSNSILKVFGRKL